MKLKILFVMLISLSIYGQEEVPKEALKIAQKTLKSKTGYFGNFDFKRKLFSFEESTSQSDLKLGTPFRLYHIDNDVLLNASRKTTVSSLCDTTVCWLFPVIEHDRMIIRIEVDNKHGKWEVGAIGGTALMPEWQKISEAWSFDKGYHPILLEGSRLYFHVPEVDAYNLTTIIYAQHYTQRDHYRTLKAEIMNLSSDLRKYFSKNFKVVK